MRNEPAVTRRAFYILTSKKYDLSNNLAHLNAVNESRRGRRAENARAGSMDHLVGRLHETLFYSNLGGHKVNWIFVMKWLYFKFTRRATRAARAARAALWL